MAPTVGRFLKFRVSKMAFVKLHIHIPIPYFPILIFTPLNQEDGPLYPLAMSVPVVQPGFVNLGSKRWNEATKQGEGVGRAICF